MKRLYSLTFAAMAAASMVVGAQEAPTVFNVVADTWVRTDAPSNKYGTSGTIETRNSAVKDADGNVTGYNYFMSLVGFEYQLPEGKKVKNATLRLVTERNKGGKVEVRFYGNDFDEAGATWNSESGYIDAALARTSVVEFSVAGQLNKAMWDNNIDATSSTLSAWVNDINVTDLVKSASPTATRVNFLINQTREQAREQVCFFTKEHAGYAEAVPAGFTATTDELKPVLTVEFEDDAETSTLSLLPTADTFVRVSAANNNYGGNGDLEIYHTVDATSGVRSGQFYGLMSFAMPAEVINGTHEIVNATLKFSHTMCKGDRWMELYAYPSTFDEKGAKWNTEIDKINEALATAPFASYSANGQGGKAIWDNGITEQYQNAEAWTNRIDITDYLKAHPENLNILIAKKTGTGNNPVRIATKEVGDQTKYNIPAADLLPALNLTITKKQGGNTGSIEVVPDNDAPVEYYNLQGVRVEQPTHGLYIIKQGTRVSKAVL